MRFKLFIISVLSFVLASLSAQTALSFPSDSIYEDSVCKFCPNIVSYDEKLPLNVLIGHVSQKMLADSSAYHFVQSLSTLKMTASDSLVYYTNPFFIDLIYLGKSVDIRFRQNLTDMHSVYFGKKAEKLDKYKPEAIPKIKFADKTGTISLQRIRNTARDYITTHAAELYAVNIWDLPDANLYKSRTIKPNGTERVQVSNDNLSLLRGGKMNLPNLKPVYWQRSANVLMQFTQNYFSDNWYKGGAGNRALLTVVSANLNYDNKKNIKWDNAIEWRVGMMSVDDTTSLRSININEDLFKIDSKFALKAKGNWSYSVLMNFSTQLFDNYKSYNSNDLKAKLLTPINLDFGVGMNYSYKKMFSLMLAPVAYKMKFLADTAVVKIIDGKKIQVNPGNYGIEVGKNQVHNFGSSFTVQLTKWKPFDELEINSTFKFFADFKFTSFQYNNVEIDWETVANFTINRYLSTRLVINPRYDNFTIKKDPKTGEEKKAGIQLKELLSFGFNYKFQ